VQCGPLLVTPAPQSAGSFPRPQPPSQPEFLITLTATDREGVHGVVTAGCSWAFSTSASPPGSTERSGGPWPVFYGPNAKYRSQWAAQPGLKAAPQVGHVWSARRSAPAVIVSPQMPHSTVGAARRSGGQRLVSCDATARWHRKHG
jgi:hypothetical protein